MSKPSHLRKASPTDDKPPQSAVTSLPTREETPHLRRRSDSAFSAAEFQERVTQTGSPMYAVKEIFANHLEKIVLWIIYGNH